MYSQDFGGDVDGRVPVFKFREDGKIQNVRPTIYHQNAVAQQRQHGPKGRIGYRVKNRFGDIKPMTFKQAERLIDLFETRQLEIVDFWTVHSVSSDYALTGYDTEMEGHGANSIYSMPPADR